MALTVLKRGVSGEDVQKLQFGLAAMTYHPGPMDRNFGPDTERAVSVFQYARRILADGVAGPITLSEYNNALHEMAGRTGRGDLVSYRIPQRYNLINPMGVKKRKRLRFISHDIKGWNGEYFQDARVVLRADAAKAFLELQQAVHDLGGVLTCENDGSKRTLARSSSQYRSRMSFHYLGLAFDLHPMSGMQDPLIDPFLVEWSSRDLSRRWTIWARSSKALPHRTLKVWRAVRYKNRKHKAYTVLHQQEVGGSFFNFTDLARRFGFRGIPVRRFFLNGGRYTGADWWHLQWEEGLTYGRTTFGEEMAKVYGLERIRRDFQYWGRVKNLRYGVEWV